jgi:hypothetical protein
MQTEAAAAVVVAPLMKVNTLAEAAVAELLAEVVTEEVLFLIIHQKLAKLLDLAEAAAVALETMAIPTPQV